MTASNLGVIGTLVGILSAIAGVWYLNRGSQRALADARQKEIDAAEARGEERVRDQLNATREALRSMESDRNYWRDRSGAYDDELRRRER